MCLIHHCIIAFQFVFLLDLSSKMSGRLVPQHFRLLRTELLVTPR